MLLTVAVIVATKNRSELLAKRSLLSIENQTVEPDYLIVCDDSSTEHCINNKSIVQRMSTSKCRTLYLQNTRTPGASGSWNSAVDALLTYVESPTEVVLAFLDDDDAWADNYLELCSEALQSLNLDMVSSGINRIESKTSPNNFQNFAPESLVVSQFLTGNPGIQGSNLFLRLSTFLEAGGFDESLTSCTDRDLGIRLAELGSVRYKALDQCLVNHYADTDRLRLSSRGSKAKLSGLTAFWKKYSRRMSDKQKRDFIKRSSDFFDWQYPDKSCFEKIKLSANKALTFAVTAEIDLEVLKSLVILFKYFRNFDLVGLDVVFHSDARNKTHQEFSKILRDLGVGCFSISPALEIREYIVQVASLRPGSRVWIVENMLDADVEKYQDVESWLSSCGAIAVSKSVCTHNKSAKIETSLIESDIHNQRVVSARHRIAHHFNTENLRILGSGSEAIVFTDEKTVFKCIDYWKTRTPEEQFEFLRTQGPSWVNIPGIYGLKTVVRDGVWVLLSYPFEKSEPYKGGYERLMIQLINGCTRAGIVCNNIHPQNLILTQTELKLIDYGSDIRPWNELGFEHMARRAYLACWSANRPDLKVLMRRSMSEVDMPELAGFSQFRAKLDRPVRAPRMAQFGGDAAPDHTPFGLVIGVITGDPIMLLPLLNSLRVLLDHTSICSLSVIVLCNGCEALDLAEAINGMGLEAIDITPISEQDQRNDVRAGYFGAEICARPEGQVGIAFARTMLQRYLGERLVKQSGSIGWILDDDMRIDTRACEYLRWLPAFREQGVDVLLGAYEGSSPNPPLNGLRVQLMDLVHNLAWLSKLPEESVLPDRSNENGIQRKKFPDYYYDLSRKHSAHLESPFWLEPSYTYETVKEARARLFSGALGILNGTPLTRGIVATKCENPLLEAKDSVNRGGCTFILNPDSVLRTPNVIPKLHGREVRRSDMIWAMINRYYRGMTIKVVSFPVSHIGRKQVEPTINAEKVQSEIVGSALYAGLNEFLGAHPDHQLSFSENEVDLIYEMMIRQMSSRLRLLEKSFYRIHGLARVLSKTEFSDELGPLTRCIEIEFSISSFKKIQSSVKAMTKQDVSCFLSEMTKFADSYSAAIDKNSSINGTANSQC